MNKQALLFCGLIALYLPAQSFAEPVVFSGRVGPVVGTYKGEVDVVVTDLSTGQSGSASEGGDNEPLYGLQTGLRAGMGDFFLDASIEFMQVKFQDDKLDRTDLVLTGGYFVGSNWTFFGGYRQGMQGDGFFNDDTVKEGGPFVGAGFGGMKAGATEWNASLAYNLSEAEFPTGTGDFEFDYPGLSLKVGALFVNMPAHSVQLRYQRFNGDETIEDSGFRANLELTETYLQLSYLYSFGF